MDSRWRRPSAAIVRPGTFPSSFLSAANTDKKFITKGYTSGGSDYITKPIDPDILLLKVKTFYRLYEQNSELNRIQASLRSEIEFRKKVEDELQERARELHSILESIPQIAFTTGPMERSSL
jgi:two-component system phosphate regulon sensor histidine kinase PhoR